MELPTRPRLPWNALLLLATVATTLWAGFGLAPEAAEGPITVARVAAPACTTALASLTAS